MRPFCCCGDCACCCHNTQVRPVTRYGGPSQSSRPCVVGRLDAAVRAMGRKRLRRKEDAASGQLKAWYMMLTKEEFKEIKVKYWRDQILEAAEGAPEN